MDLDIYDAFDVYDVYDGDGNARIPRVPKRYIRDAQNPFEWWRDIEFLRRYRFSKDGVRYRLLPLVEDGLSKPTQRGLPIAPVLQLLLALRFYATASFQVSLL